MVLFPGGHLLAGGPRGGSDSSPQKAQLAAAAGADHVINYRQQDLVAEVHKIVPNGVDSIVEVNPAQNAAIDAQIVAPNGCGRPLRRQRGVGA